MSPLKTSAGVSEWVSERVSDWVIEWVSEWMSEWASGEGLRRFKIDSIRSPAPFFLKCKKEKWKNKSWNGPGGTPLYKHQDSSTRDHRHIYWHSSTYIRTHSHARNATSFPFFVLCFYPLHHFPLMDWIDLLLCYHVCQPTLLLTIIIIIIIIIIVIVIIIVVRWDALSSSLRITLRPSAKDRGQLLRDQPSKDLSIYPSTYPSIYPSISIHHLSFIYLFIVFNFVIPGKPGTYLKRNDSYHHQPWKRMVIYTTTTLLYTLLVTLLLVIVE